MAAFPPADPAVAQRLANLRAFAADLASRCRCAELMEDDDPCGASCPWCEKQARLARFAPRLVARIRARSPSPSPLSSRREERRQAAYAAGAERRASLRSSARARAVAAAWPAVAAAAPAPAPAHTPFAADVAVIREKLIAQAAAVGVPAKVAAAREVFCALFAFPAMLASAPRLRETILAKMAELELSEHSAPLRPLFTEARAFCERLAARADFVAA